MKEQVVKMHKYIFRINGSLFDAIASNVDEAIIEAMRLYHRAWNGEIATIQRDTEREKSEPYNEREHILMRLIPDDE